MSEVIGKPDLLLVPVKEMDEAVAFYTEALGCELRFRDGDRFASLALGELKIGLAAPGEHPGEAPALSLRVGSLEDAAARVRAAGADPAGQVTESEHERSLGVADPAGNLFVLYQPVDQG